MKKYMPTLAIVVFVLVVLSFSSFLLQKKQTEKAQEAYQAEQHILVYSDMPGDVNSALAQAFYKDTGLRVRIETHTDEELQTLAADVASQNGPDMVIASEPVLKDLHHAAVLVPYSSMITDSIPAAFKADDACWTGIWYDPMVFVVSSDYYVRRGSELKTWGDLLTDPMMVLSFPDLAATDIAGDFLCSYVEMAGTEEAERYFRALQAHVAAYTKSMSPVVRRVAAGEADVGVADAMTVRQFLKDRAPVVMLYPQDGTSYWLYGSAWTKWCTDSEQAAVFSDWLLSRSALALLHENNLFLTTASDVLPKELDGRSRYPVLFPVRKLYTDQGRRNMQEWWIKTIRFGKES